MSDGHPSWPALGPRLSGQSTLYPMVNDWPDVTFPILSDWPVCVVLTCSWWPILFIPSLKNDWPVVYVSILIDWPVLHYTHSLNWLASSCIIPLLWLTGRLCVCIHLWLTGQSCIIPIFWLTGQLCVVSIFDWLASLALYPSLTDWPVVYCIHLWLTGSLCIIPIFWLTGQSCVVLICNWLAQSCVIPIFDWLAGCVLYPSAAGWSALGCNPTLGLCMWWIGIYVDWLLWLIYIWNLSSFNGLAQERTKLGFITINISSGIIFLRRFQILIILQWYGLYHALYKNDAESEWNNSIDLSKLMIYISSDAK